MSRVTSTHSDFTDPDECSSDDDRSSGATWGMLLGAGREWPPTNAVCGGGMLRRDDELGVNDLRPRQVTVSAAQGQQGQHAKRRRQAGLETVPGRSTE